MKHPRICALSCRHETALSLAFAASAPGDPVVRRCRRSRRGGVKAFTGARVIDGTDRAPIDNATIVVRDGRIVAVGPAASVTVPAGAERVSLAGKTVIPGLVNAHGHVGDTASGGTLLAENVHARSAHLRRLRRDDGRLASATTRRRASPRATPADARRSTARGSSSPARCSRRRRRTRRASWSPTTRR